MDLLDAGIILLLVTALVRGWQLGLLRQFGSTAGFFGGVFLGVFLQGKLVQFAHSTGSKALLAVFVLAVSVLALISVGETLGQAVKYRLQRFKIANVLDGALGLLIAGATLLAGVWIGAAMFAKLPALGLQRQISRSFIVSQLERSLPPAPNILASLGHLINPNGFPDVFVGLEPRQNTTAPLPAVGDLQAALDKTRDSVVKISGKGCGGIVDGSGFIAADGLVITNAHVVAGVTQPTVIDGNGEHSTTVIAFDPNLDLAVLRTVGLRGAPLTLDSSTAANNVPALVEGYPGGGNFAVAAATVLDSFQATGRNIYNEGTTNRQVYSLKASVRPGNSGGPLINKDGSVIGVVFAESTTYDNVGYALTMQQVVNEFHQADTNTQAVGTGSCAE